MITAEEKLEAVEREIKLRRRVYPNRIETGRMSVDFANRQIAIFVEIADDYRAKAKDDQLL